MSSRASARQWLHLLALIAVCGLLTVGRLTRAQPIVIGELPLQSPRSSTSEANLRPWYIWVTSSNRLASVIADLSTADLDQVVDVGVLFPEWRSVGEYDIPGHTINGRRVRPLAHTQVLEGVVTGAHVSFEDVPISHYTHDFCFFVDPDPAFETLLGIQQESECDSWRRELEKRHAYLAFNREWERKALGAEGRRVAAIRRNLAEGLVAETARDLQMRCNPSMLETLQQAVEVEWESGLAANSGLCGPANRDGRSCGFFSSGHERREVVWQWPTVGDWVHVDGLWVWDRGHPPAKTEIHPPRLVAIQRKLPERINRDRIEQGADDPWMLATRADVFASGDGSAFWNNRPSPANYVERVIMNDRDYSFIIRHALPRPGRAPLGSRILHRRGHTFRGEAEIRQFPDGSTEEPSPHVRVTIPWRRRGEPNDAVFAQTLYVYWDDSLHHGVSETYVPRIFRVTLDRLIVKDPHDGVWSGGASRRPSGVGGGVVQRGPNPGQFRIFSEVGGNWLLLNEFAGGANVMTSGLGHAEAGETFSIGRSFDVVVPPGSTFRIHADGWEADGMDGILGRIRDPYLRGSTTDAWLNENMFSQSVWLSGCADDPLGEISDVIASDHGIGPAGSTSSGQTQSEKEDPCGATDPNGSYEMHYTLATLPWSRAVVADPVVQLVPRELARGKPARQSSVSEWSNPNDAGGAVDGRKTGGFGFHTALEDRPYWEVDLGSSYRLNEVRIFNRGGAHAGRARTVEVHLSDDGNNWSKAYSHDGSEFGGSEGQPLVVDLAWKSARYLRLQLAERTWLHLDEVEVYGTR